jgi:hypothetical protein
MGELEGEKPWDRYHARASFSFPSALVRPFSSTKEAYAKTLGRSLETSRHTAACVCVCPHMNPPVLEQL